VDPAKVPASGVRARCSVCGALIRIASPAATPVLDTVRVPTPAGVTAGGGGWGTPAGSGTVTPARGVTPPALPAFDPSTPAGSLPPIDATPMREDFPPTPTFVTPALPSPAIPTPVAAPTIPTPATSLPVAFPTPVAPAAAMPTPTTMPTPVEATPVAMPTPMTAAPTPVPPPPTPSVPLRPLVPPPPMSPAQLVTPAAPAPAAPAPARPAAAVGPDGKRVINPFLKSDPQTRARRLARALVSDMVAYQPQKRADALANGTLKQVFRDEIRRSYDEYVDQVGRELAESTTYFQEALNEVLAEGRPLF
jgi:hypothetical protein